jgi:hypothetical protein
MKGWILDIVIALVKQVIELVTPELVDFLRDQIKVFAKKARETENAWDDILANALCLIFDVPKNGI